MTKILITGASGFIGTSLKKKLEEEHEIIPFDIRNNPDQDIRYVKKLPECDGIIHLAALSGVEQSENNQELCIDINYKGTLNLLNLVRDDDNIKFFIYSSSREVFGEVGKFPATERTFKKPINVYGIAKYASELLCQEYAKRYSKIIRVLRFPNVYTNNDDQMCRVIPIFIKRALNNETLYINGTGEETFDFIHISDTIRGIEFTLRDVLIPSPLLYNDFNICTNKPITLFQLAKTIIHETKSKSKIAFRAGRSYDVSCFYSSYQKAKSILDFEPKVSFKEGIKQSIEILK